MESDFCDFTVAVVGLGLMGGSLAAALRSSGACRKVVGIARRSVTLTTARMLQFIDEGTTDLATGVAEADMVVLATPVRDILAKLEVIGPMLKPGCIVMDVGSTKAEICTAMARLPEHVQPVGAHPMCGKESSGLTMAEPNLYRDRVFVLVPLERTTPTAFRMAHALVDAVGGRPLILEAPRHDRMVAAISHLPFLLAVTLVNAAEAFSQGEELTWDLAAGGFRDTSRVAGGSVAMMMDILATNRGPILQALESARKELDSLIENIEAQDQVALQTHLETARRRRREVFR